MTNENSAIWRATTAQGAEEVDALDANKILFNPTPVIKNGSFVFNTEVHYRNATPENPRVGGQINEVQDMGLDGIDMQITGQFRETSSITKDLQKLTTWLKEDKTIQVGFRNGVTGLRLDDLPQFNVQPTANSGYVLAEARIIRDGEFKGKAAFVITLRFSGDPAGLGTP